MTMIAPTGNYWQASQKPLWLPVAYDRPRFSGKIARAFPMADFRCRRRRAIILIHAYYYGKIRALDGVIGSR